MKSPNSSNACSKICYSDINVKVVKVEMNIALTENEVNKCMKKKHER